MRTKSSLGVGRATFFGNGPFFLASYPTGSFLSVASTNSSIAVENLPDGSLGAGSLTMYCRSSRIDIWCPDPASETPATLFRLADLADDAEVFLLLGLARAASRFAARRFSASWTLSLFFAGRTAESVSSASSSSVMSPSSSSSWTPVRVSWERSSSSERGASSDEKGKRPSASSTRVMPSDQTSDLTVYGSPEIRSGCNDNSVHELAGAWGKSDARSCRC